MSISANENLNVNKEELYQWGASLIQSGKSQPFVAHALEEKGLDEETARQWSEKFEKEYRLVQNLESDSMAYSKDYSDLIWGAVWLIGGGLVTAATYLMASSSGGGSYLLAWGPMIYGGMRMLKGLFA